MLTATFHPQLRLGAYLILPGDNIRLLRIFIQSFWSGLILLFTTFLSESVSPESGINSKFIIFSVPVSEFVRSKRGQGVLGEDVVRVTIPNSSEGTGKLYQNTDYWQGLYIKEVAAILVSSCQFFKRYRKSSFDCVWTRPGMKLST